MDAFMQTAKELTDLIERGFDRLQEQEQAARQADELRRERERKDWEEFNAACRAALPAVLQPYLQPVKLEGFRPIDFLWGAFVEIRIPYLAPVRVALSRVGVHWPPQFSLAVTCKVNWTYAVPSVDRRYDPDNGAMGVDYEWDGGLTKGFSAGELDMALATAKLVYELLEQQQAALTQETPVEKPLPAAENPRYEDLEQNELFVAPTEDTYRRILREELRRDRQTQRRGIIRSAVALAVR